MDVAALGFRAESGDLKRANDELRKMPAAAGAAERAAKDWGNSTTKAGAAARAANDNAARSAHGMASAFQIATRAVATFGGALAAALLGGRGLREFAEFEQGLRNVAAVSGATAEELDKLDSAALRAAASTRFNPRQTTEALYALASSGQSAGQQIATLPNVLNLAEAGQASLAQSTELVTSTLNVFGIAAENSTRVVDTFVASIGASALNVPRLQVALRNAAPTAAALNQSLEGTTAVLGTLTTAFGNGERAGTGFRAILTELPEKAKAMGVAIKGSNGEFLPFVDILRKIEQRGVTAGNAVELFGAEAGPALAALIKTGSAALSEMEGRIQSSGQAAEVAAKQLDTLSGDIAGLQSAISVAFVEIGRAESGFARSTIQTVTNLLRLWSGYGDTLGEAREATERLSSAIEALAVAGGSVLLARFVVPSIAAFASMASGMSAATVAARGLGAALAIVGGPWAAAIMAIAGAVYYLAGAESAAEKATRQHESALRALNAAIAETNLANEAAVNSTRQLIVEDINAAKAALQHAEARIALRKAAFDDAGGGAAGMFAAMEADRSGEDVNIRAEIERQEAQIKGLQTMLGRFNEQAENYTAPDIGSAAEAATSSFRALDKAMEKQRKNYADITRGAQQFIEQQQLEASTLGMTEEAANALRYEQELLNKAANDNIKLTAGQKAELTGLAQTMAETEAETSKLKSAYDFAKSTVSGFFNDFRSGLEQGKGIWKSFGDAALGVLGRIGDKLIELATDQLINGLFSNLGGLGGGGGGGIIGGIMGWLFNAKGNAFSQGNVIPFANGGVVSSATMFPMSGGRSGVMGEAGPEAIMPLKRGPDGRLGVSAPRGASAPSQTTYAPTYNIDASNSSNPEETRRQVTSALKEYDKGTYQRWLANQAQARKRNAA
ncbi:MAG: phage tail tape measure protein [Nitratireductor rhodophyticola]|uniref:phage tail tape measure protein n=1 Tax=Nitratireductor rhodophyticola TaxID=2854036 RepID=UPI0032D8D1EC